jgi:hypothetical protein
MELQKSPATGMVRPARMEGKDLGESFTSNKKEKYNELCFKIYEKAPVNIHLKVKRPDTTLVEAKKGNKWGPFYIFNVMAKSKIRFQYIR